LWGRAPDRWIRVASGNYEKKPAEVLTKCSRVYVAFLESKRGGRSREVEAAQRERYIRELASMAGPAAVRGRIKVEWMERERQVKVFRSQRKHRRTYRAHVMVSWPAG